MPFICVYSQFDQRVKWDEGIRVDPLDHIPAQITDKNRKKVYWNYTPRHWFNRGFCVLNLYEGNTHKKTTKTDLLRVRNEDCVIDMSKTEPYLANELLCPLNYMLSV